MMKGQEAKNSENIVVESDAQAIILFGNRFQISVV
jgi:hypothetical protein